MAELSVIQLAVMAAYINDNPVPQAEMVTIDRNKQALNRPNTESEITQPKSVEELTQLLSGV